MSGMHVAGAQSPATGTFVVAKLVHGGDAGRLNGEMTKEQADAVAGILNCLDALATYIAIPADRYEVLLAECARPIMKGRIETYLTTPSDHYDPPMMANYFRKSAIIEKE